MWEDREHDKLQDKLQESELKMSALEEKLRDAKAYRKRPHRDAPPRKWLSRRAGSSVSPAAALKVSASDTDPAQPAMLTPMRSSPGPIAPRACCEMQASTCCGEATTPARRPVQVLAAVPPPVPGARALQPQPAPSAPQQAAGGGLAAGPPREWAAAALSPSAAERRRAGVS